MQAEGVPSKRAALVKAVVSIHEKYSAHSLDMQLVGENEPLAYSLFRMPATYAAVQYVLSRLHEHDPHFQPTSLLDIGCGPGTAYFAMKERYPTLQQVMAIDRNRGFLELFQSLANEIGCPLPELVCQEASMMSTDRHWDVGICSYMLGELDEREQRNVLEKAARSCETFLILEPGTPRGYETILRMREWAISHGFNIVAPCPHHHACPMRLSQSWCHVRVRLMRPHFQQALKEGTLGYEDEPLCYVILQKRSVSFNWSRVVDTPQKRKGHVNLNLCQSDGQLHKVVVSKKSKDLYIQAKELEWGDLWRHNF